MVFGCVGSRRVRIRALLGLAGVVALALSVAASPAEAARKKRRHVGGGYAPPYAAMVVDVKSGRTLHAVNEDAPRIPASLTKVMTLYLLFEQLERGRYTMNSELRVSAHAASQAPSKIGFRPGETIEVRDAILALVTKSANDVAMAVAENVAGSEDEFAQMMTTRARSLGMSRTSFHNPHGLPHNPPNLTTARDLTVLARAIQERFPRYYPMFSTRVFNYAGGAYRNHNRLLGRVEGVDGIKTGYTNASGFNLMTSAKSEGRQIVSVVLGGRSGSSRDKIMADLVAENLPRAATGGRSAPMVAEVEPEARPRPAQRPVPVVAEAQPEPRPAARVAAAPQQPEMDDELPPIPVPRPHIEREQPALPATARAYAPAQATTTTPVAPPRPANVGAAQQLELSGMRPVTATTTPSAMRWSVGAQPADAKVLRPPVNVDVTSSIAKVAEPQEIKLAKAPEPKVEPVKAADSKIELRHPEVAPAISHAKPESPVANLAGKWMIQLGATDDEAKAKDILARARAQASSQLSEAAAFTEKVEKGGATLFRARFAGFEDPKDAQNACAKLKRGGFACFATRG